MEYYNLVGDYVVPVDGCKLRAQPLAVLLRVPLIAENVGGSVGQHIESAQLVGAFLKCQFVSMTR